MADTLWIDTDWTLAQWEDETLTVRIAYLWEFLKGASDERQAFIEQVHSGSFDANKEFPSFGDFMGFAISGQDVVNNVEKIVAALNNTAGTKFDFIKTDTIKADGTTVSDSARADYLDLGDILTDVLGYGDDELLISLDTDEGNDTAFLKTAWTKQLFEVMNYPRYYARQMTNIVDDFFSEIQIQQTSLQLQYNINNVLGTATAVANYFNPPNGVVDLYIANDLNETAPFSNSQEVYDYTESTYDGQLSGADWETQSTSMLNTTLKVSAVESIDRGASGAETKYSASNNRLRLRFKVNNNKRAESPNTYLAALKFYFFLYEKLSTVNTIYSDFGMGISALESQFIVLAPDIDDYYYLEPLVKPDFKTFTVPLFPALGVKNTNIEVNHQQSLNEFTNTPTPELSTHRTDIMVEANNSDGTAFEYYTPS